MPKPAALFVPVAMAVTAVCVGVIASFGLGLNGAAASLVALTALVLMAVTHAAFTRAPPNEDGRIDDLDRIVAEIEERLEALEQRLVTLDSVTQERARAATRPLVEEIAALGGLVTSVAKEVAAHDVAIARLKIAADDAAPAPAGPFPVPERRSPAPRPAPAPVAPPAPPALAADPFDPDARDGEPPDVPAPAAREEPDPLARALAENRLEIHIEPIVSLPGRRVIAYQALPRVREGGAWLAPGRSPVHGAEVARRSCAAALSLAERLAASGREVSVLVAAEGAASDERLLRELVEMVAAKPELARLVAIELDQGDVASLGPAARMALAVAVERGVRLSLSDATDLAADPRELARRGVRYLKVAALRLLDPEATRGAEIHAADLANHLSRHGVELVATGVDAERVVPELLDLDVRAAQGPLFGAPRPVKPAAPAPGAASAR